MLNLVFVSLALLLGESRQQGIKSLLPTAAAPLIVSNNYVTLSLYQVPATYSAQVNLLTYTATPPRLSQYFEMYVVQYTPIINEAYSFMYNSTSGEVMSFTLFLRSNNGNQLQATTCGQLSDMIPIDGSTSLGCDNGAGGYFQVGVQIKAGNFLTFGAPWSVVQNPNQIVANTIYKCTFSVQYTPSVNQQTTVVSGPFNYLNLAFAAKQTNPNYITFESANFLNADCPADCASCDNTGTCQACLGNFTLNTQNNTCTCNTTLAIAPGVSNTSQFTINGSTVNVYVPQRVCNANIGSFQVCINNILNIDQPLNFNLYTNSSFNTETAITVGLNYTSPSNLASISSVCRGYIKVLFSTPLDGSEGMSVKLAEPIALDLAATQIVNFGNLQYCQNYDYPNFGIAATVCVVQTDFVLYQPTLNQTLFSRNNSLTTIKDRSIGTVTASYFLNSYIPNKLFNVTTTPWVSALVCLDPGCLTAPTSANLTRGQVLYVIVAISDPLFLQQAPTVYPFLLMNNYQRKSLLLLSQRRLFNEYMFAISLDSLELSNKTTVILLLSYGLVTPSNYNNTEVVSFAINIPPTDVVSTGVVPYIKSIDFVWMITSVSILVAGALAGLAAWGVSKFLRKEDMDAPQTKLEREIRGANRFIELTTPSPRGKVSVLEVMRSRKNSPPPMEAKGIFEKLMR